MGWARWAGRAGKSTGLLRCFDHTKGPESRVPPRTDERSSRASEIHPNGEEKGARCPSAEVPYGHQGGKLLAMGDRSEVRRVIEFAQSISSVKEIGTNETELEE